MRTQLRCRYNDFLKFIICIRSVVSCDLLSVEELLNYYIRYDYCAQRDWFALDDKRK